RWPRRRCCSVRPPAGRPARCGSCAAACRRSPAAPARTRRAARCGIRPKPPRGRPAPRPPPAACCPPPPSAAPPPRRTRAPGWGSSGRTSRRASCARRSAAGRAPRRCRGRAPARCAASSPPPGTAPPRSGARRRPAARRSAPARPSGGACARRCAARAAGTARPPGCWGRLPPRSAAAARPRTGPRRTAACPRAAPRRGPAGSYPPGCATRRRACPPARPRSSGRPPAPCRRPGARRPALGQALLDALGAGHLLGPLVLLGADALDLVAQLLAHGRLQLLGHLLRLHQPVERLLPLALAAQLGALPPPPLHLLARAAHPLLLLDGGRLLVHAALRLLAQVHQLGVVAGAADGAFLLLDVEHADGGVRVVEAQRAHALLVVGQVALDEVHAVRAHVEARALAQAHRLLEAHERLLAVAAAYGALGVAVVVVPLLDGPGRGDGG